MTTPVRQLIPTPDRLQPPKGPGFGSDEQGRAIHVPGASTTGTVPPSTASTVQTNGGSSTRDQVVRWGVAMGVAWFVLTLMADLGDTAELAAALAVLILFTVLMKYGPQALANLGFLGGK